jgi:hypothetical protein
MFLLNVEKTRHKFPECKQRLLEWMSPGNAAGRVQEPELQKLPSQIVGVQANSPPQEPVGVAAIS